MKNSQEVKILVKLVIDGIGQEGSPRGTRIQDYYHKHFKRELFSLNGHHPSLTKAQLK